jgi:iron complex transport system ATP-binding protein
VIRATDIRLELGGKTILDRIDCALEPGRVSVIMGKNGAGKSSLLNVLAGSEPLPARGSVRLDGDAIHQLPARELARRRAVLAQHAPLGFALSVREVVEIGCYGCYHDWTRRQRNRLVDEHLDLLELIDFADRSFPTLSGGEQKRVLLAKCLLQLAAGRHPGNRYLLLDEPTAALDIEQQYRFVDLATRLARNRGVGIVAVLHDLNLAARFADHLLLLRGGRLVASGGVHRVFTPSFIRATFDVDCLIQDHPTLDRPLITPLPYGDHAPRIPTQRTTRVPTRT